MSKGNSKRDSSIVQFHVIANAAALVAGAASFQVSPSGLNALSTRFGNMADGWAHFRVRALRFRLLAPPLVTATSVAMGYVGGVQDTPPATFALVGELISATAMMPGGNQTCPSNWVKCSKQEIAGPFPWYKSVNGTADTTEEAPGYLVFGGTGTSVFSFEFYITLEFKISIDPANTPAAVAMRQALFDLRREAARKKEKESLEQVLGGTVVLSGTTGRK